MMHPIQTRLNLELEKFNLLPKKAQNLLLSFLLNSAANPLLGTFMNAYIWKTEGNFLGVVLFNLGIFIGLPITFFINGYLLRYINIGVLYTLGNVTLGLGVMVTILLAKLGFQYYLFYGVIIGIGYGFYWANRNYLTLKQTESANRNYFMGISSAFETITAIMVPFLMGWFIYYGSIVGLNTYVINSVFAFLFLLLAGLLVFRGNYKTPKVERVVVKQASTSWKRVRAFVFAVGIIDGLSAFLVSMLILGNMGHEGTLGSVDSFVSILLGLLFYFYGRKAKIHHQKRVYLGSVSTGIVGSLFLLFSGVGIFNVIVFTSLYYFALSFMWLSAEPMLMDIMDREVQRVPQGRYGLVFDREMFLNMGRWISVLMFVSLVFVWGAQTALRISPLITFVLHALVLIMIWRGLNASLEVDIDKKTQWI